MGDRCTGHCCQKFTLPYPPDYLWQMYYNWIKYKGPPPENDIHIIAPMVKYLGVGKNEGSVTPLEEQAKRHWYTCKHYDAEHGNCGIYEHRPNMCKDYPYASPCMYKSCTWDDGRDGVYPPHEYANRLLKHLDPEDPRYRVFAKEIVKLDKVVEDLKSDTVPSDGELLAANAEVK